MFWRCDEKRLADGLERLGQRLVLSKESDTALSDLIVWLECQHSAVEDEWSHDEFLEALVSGSNSDRDKVIVLREVRDSLRAMEVFAVTLVEKLATFRATLDQEQKRVLANELNSRGRNHGSWRGWHRRHRLQHPGRAV